MQLAKDFLLYENIMKAISAKVRISELIDCFIALV